MGKTVSLRNSVVSEYEVENTIRFIRSKKVILDRDLAKLYGVTTGNLNKTVQRHLKRFPEDFMFQLTKIELDNLIFQFGTSSWGGIRKLPHAFTEQGIAMLSSVLNSERAILVNIQIMRAFVNLRRLGLTYVELRRKIDAMERKYDGNFKIVFGAIKKLITPEPEHKKSKIGFHSA